MLIIKQCLTRCRTAIRKTITNLLDIKLMTVLDNYTKCSNKGANISDDLTSQIMSFIIKDANVLQAYKAPSDKVSILMKKGFDNEPLQMMNT